MPRAVDPRNIEADYDPNRSGTEFHVQQYLLTQAEAFAQSIELLIEQAHQAVIDFIKNLTGIDLSGVEEFFGSLFEGVLGSIGLDLPAFAALNPITLLQSLFAAFDGIDITNPGAILRTILDALEGVPVLGDILQLIENIVLGGGGDSGFPYTFPFTFGGAVSPVVAFFNNFRHFFDFVDFSSNGFNFTTAWSNFLSVTALGDALQGLQDFIQQIIDAILEKLTGLPVVGGLISHLADELGDLSDGVQDALADAGDALGHLAEGFANIFNGWFGGHSATGTAAEVATTITAIRDAVLNGYTVHTVTSDEVNWVVPSPVPVDFTAILISGGQSGSGGSSSSGSGGNGGLHGSYIAVPIDLTGTAGLDIRIGTAGNFSYIREANLTTPHTGTIIAQSAVHGSAGGMATEFGLTATASLPGSGGKGSNYNSSSGTAGESSSFATGGARGASGVFGSGGSAGGSVSAGAQIKCGGAGGGGGGAATVAFNTGGSGGAGGYPGGGGGGGGASNGVAAGSGGAGAPGVVWLFYK